MGERTEGYRALLETKERRKPELLRRGGIQGVGVGRGELVVYAERGIPVEKEIEDKPVRVIRTGKISVLLGVGRHKRWRPAPSGVGIGNVNSIGWGTLTAVVLKNGEKKILGCRHVLAYGDCPLDTFILQPYPLPGSYLSKDKIGTLESYIPLKAGVNEVDCALVRLYNQEDVVPNVLLRDKTYTPCIIPAGVEDAYSGQGVVKSGASTGVLYSSVISTDTTTTVLTELGARVYNGCIITGKIASSGDSGAILLDKSSNKAVGMAFAASDTITTHIPMKETLSALGCTLYTAGEGEPSYIPLEMAYLKIRSSPSEAEIWLKKHTTPPTGFYDTEKVTPSTIEIEPAETYDVMFRKLGYRDMILANNNLLEGGTMSLGPTLAPVTLPPTTPKTYIEFRSIPQGATIWLKKH